MSVDWIGEGGSSGALLGWHAESARDVNGDGYADVHGGAIQYTNGQSQEGAAYLYFGGPSGPAATADWIFECNQAGARCGFAVASAGDVNGDGYDDILVGADLYDHTAADEGRIFLFYGSPTGPASTPDWTMDAGQAGARLGTGVSGAGDVNGDGYDDFAVTASAYDGAQPDAGGGGFDDLILGASQYAGQGGVFLFPGSAMGLGAAPAISITTDSTTSSSVRGSIRTVRAARVAFWCSRDRRRGRVQRRPWLPNRIRPGPASAGPPKGRAT